MERLADREQPDRERRHLDAVEKLRHPEGEARLSGQDVDADEAEDESEEQAGQAPERRVAEGRRDGHEGDAHQGEIILRPEADGDVDEPGGQEGDAERGDDAGHEGADGGGREGRPAAAGLGHAVALERRDHRRALARRVDEDGGGRAAIHAAVIDAGEHDERPARIHLEGDRQEQGDRERRADAGQDPDGGAEEDADQREQQLRGFQGDEKALAQRS